MDGREHVDRAHRVKVFMPVVLEIVPGCTVNATIADLSREGFRLRSPVVLSVAQAMTMHLPRETVRCELRWVDGLEAGGIFHGRAQTPTW